MLAVDGTYQSQEGADTPGKRRTTPFPPETHREIIPGTAVVRSNTPRVDTQNTALTVSKPFRQVSTKDEDREHIQDIAEGTIAPFPLKAPSAPPVPEEESESNASVPFAPVQTRFNGETQEFLWLFEYGVLMDTARLNAPERLNGLALPYGPAVLKGYRLLVGTCSPSMQTQVTIVPSQEPESEVWGMLYRIPQQITLPEGTKASLVDSVHGAGKTSSIDSLLEPVQVTVHETLRKRDVPCLTYRASEIARLHFAELSSARRRDDTLVQQLATLVTKQKLPTHYVEQLEQWMQPLPAVKKAIEQNTEPLPTVAQKPLASRGVARRVPLVHSTTHARDTTRWLVVFACYLSALLLAALGVIVLKSLGYLDMLFTTPLIGVNVPVLVLIYGLLGGCLSCLIALGRSQPQYPAPFVLVTWFMRPYMGAVLALFAYLVLASGLFAVTLTPGQHEAASLLVSVCAGGCESWLFWRRTY